MIRRPRILCIFILAALRISLQGVAAQHPDGARSMALGGAATALVGLSDLGANPASWSTVGSRGLGLHAAQLYGLKELRFGSVRLVWPLKGVSLAGGVQTFGFELYRETSAVFGLARAFRPGTHRSIHLGMKMEHSMVHIKGYGTSSVPRLSVGLLIPAAPSLALGAAATNLFVLKRSMRFESARSLSLGASYSHGSHVTVTTEVSKEVRSPITARLGVESHPVPAFSIRAGLSTEPPRASGGVGLQTGPLTIDAAAERHFALGWSPALSLFVRW